MGIHHALYSAVSGLSVNADGMSVISNNIANANTKAFKSDRAEFEDLLSVSLNENSQLGRGARLRAITTAYTQGALSNTGLLTDLGIQGDGFFAVKNTGTEVQESGGMFYTRQGSFRFDKDGYISDVNGGKVQGYTAEPSGKLSTKLGDVQITQSSLAPTPTAKVTISANLDIREKPVLEEFDPLRATETSNFSSTVTLYDNWGNGHASTIYFQKQPEGDKNAWKWFATVDGREIEGGPQPDEDGDPKLATIASGELQFDADGKPLMKFKTREGQSSFIDTVEMSDAFEVKFANGATAQKIQFNFGPGEDKDGSYSNQTTTSIASKSTTHFHSQNGFEAGYLKTLKIDLDGSIRGIYTNGLERKLGAVAMATFSNNNGLQKVGRNNYIATNKSGEPRVGLPQSGTRGSIFSASLEESNVDLAQQFVEMITTQRGFQANSKAITTTDTLLEEIISLKR
jgi:flagellar hook protein FlgE